MTNTTPATQSGTTSTFRAHMLVLVGAVFISFAAFFVKGAPIDPSMVAFYRLWFGTAALFLFAAIRRENLTPSRKVLMLVVPAGFFFATDLLSWHEAILLIGPGIATILGNFQVLFLALYGVVFLGQKLGWAQRLAMPLALFGLALLLGLHEKSLPPAVLHGVGLCLVSALFYSAYILTLRQSQSLPQRLPPVANMVWVSAAAGTCVGIFCLAKGLSFAVPDGRTLLTLALLGILCQSLGWVFLSLGLPYLPPFRAGLLLLTQPALAFTWDVIFYGTATSPINILGAFLAIAAIGMGIFSPEKKKAEPDAPPQPLRVSMHPAGESARLHPKENS